MSNNERIGRALDCLKRGLEPFVRKKMRTVDDEHFDVQALLDIMKKYWPQVFGHHWGITVWVDKRGTGGTQPVGTPRTIQLRGDESGVRSYPRAPRGCWSCL